MSIEEGMDEMDCYFEPIRRDANKRLLGIEEPEFESFAEDDYITEEYDDNSYEAEEDDTPVDEPIEEQ